MEFVELLEAAESLGFEAFAERFPHAFLLETDPKDEASTRVIEPPAGGSSPKPRRVFEVVRRNGAPGPVLVGRGEDVDIRIDHPSISDRHAILELRGGRWMLTDLDSKFGTRIGTILAPGGVATGFTPGARLRLGPVLVFNFFESAKMYRVAKALAPMHHDHPAAPEGRPEKSRLEPRPSAEAASDSRPDLSGADFVIRCDPLPLVSLVEDRDYSAGRAVDNDIVLPHSSVSRRHALFRRRGDAVVVADLSSANGTSLGGRRLAKEGLAVPGGPPIVIGPFELAIETSWRGPNEATNILRSTELRGSLETMPLVDMLQAAELNHRTGSISIEAFEGVTGEIVFREGAPVRATFGSETGSAAILRMILLKAGRFVYSSKMDLGKRTIDDSFMKILLEASRRSDEGGTPARAHLRR